MSSALAVAIYRRLVGLERLEGDYLTAQLSLARLLGTDPDTGQPSVHRGNSSDIVSYPAITFRESAGTVDARFTLGASAVGLCAVDRQIYDFELWGISRSGVELSDIDAQFSLLLDQRYGPPPLPLSSGDRDSMANRKVDRMVTLVMPTDLYDDLRHAWCRLRRIEFRERSS